MPDPDFVYTPDQIRARVEHIRKVRETWRGQPGYVELLSMEIWALEKAVEFLQAARMAIDLDERSLGVPEEVLQKAAVLAIDAFPGVIVAQLRNQK